MNCVYFLLFIKMFMSQLYNLQLPLPKPMSDACKFPNVAVTGALGFVTFVVNQLNPKLKMKSN